MTGPIVMLDGREEFADDRTWCFWDVEPTPFSHLARASFDTWSVRDGTEWITVNAPETPYLCLAAMDFYAHALTSIAAHPGVELRLGVTVGEVVDHPVPDELYGLVSVSTTEGSVRARQVIDCRGFSALPDSALPDSALPDSALAGSAHSAEADHARESSTWVPQQFVGLHVVADRPVFDVTDCRLMDFGVDQSGGLRFVYVVPTSPFEALVEDVYLDETSSDQADYVARIEGYLLSEFGLASDDFRVVGDERGYIPMTDHAFVRHPSAHVTRLGMLGGATRPSTGYTFLGIQRSCRRVVQSIVDGVADVAEPPCSLLDSIFLRFLSDRPELAPRVFRLMFERVETGALVRFLTERSSTVDHLALILALPKLPFLATAWTVMRHRLRGRRTR
jgi:lycopene beta-cyclase